MKSTHRLSALALALLLLLPSMTSCGKKGLHIDQDQALEQLAISAAKAEAAKAEAKKHNAIFMILTEQNCQFLNSTKS